MLAKLIKYVEKADDFFKDIYTDTLGISHKVGSHSNAIKHLE